MQIIHWLTRNAKAENPESMSLLDALLEVATSEIGSVQAVAIQGVAEYLAYSIKQASVGDTEFKNATSLFKRLYLLLLHSSSKKRTGAGAMLNRLYSVFREEDGLVTKFSIEIVCYLFRCLKLSCEDIAAETQAQIAIGHFKKILIGKLELFGKGQEVAGVVDTVEGLFRHLLFESGSTLGNYARACLSFSLELLGASKEGILALNFTSRSPSIHFESLEGNSKSSCGYLREGIDIIGCKPTCRCIGWL
jgi:DNA-dependent protein kinase catalytic subunit